jgi:hypothetical protein
MISFLFGRKARPLTPRYDVPLNHYNATQREEGIDGFAIDADFDRFKIEPAELRAPMDAGRNRLPSAE